MNSDREGQSPVGGRVRNALFLRSDMWVMVRDGLPRGAEAPPGAICAPANLDLLRRVGDVSEQVLQKRLDRGDRATVVMLDGEPVAVRWVCLGPQLIWDLRAEVAPAPGQAIAYGGYTAPAFRRRGLSTILERSIAEGLTGEGVTGAVRVVVAGNEGGLGQAKHSGYRPLLRVRYFRVLGVGLHLVTHESGRRRVRLSLAGLSKPLRLALAEWR
jgi:hypothetical protein